MTFCQTDLPRHKALLERRVADTQVADVALEEGDIPTADRVDDSVLVLELLLAILGFRV